MVAHEVHDVGDGELALGLDPQRVGLGREVAAVVGRIELEGGGGAAEDAPDPGRGVPQFLRRQRTVNIIKPERFTGIRVVPSFFNCEWNDIGGIQAPFGIIEGEFANHRRVGVGANISVRNPDSHPDGSLSALTRSDHLQQPGFMLICNRE